MNLFGIFPININTKAIYFIFNIDITRKKGSR